MNMIYCESSHAVSGNFIWMTDEDVDAITKYSPVYFYNWVNQEHFGMKCSIVVGLEQSGHVEIVCLLPRDN